MLTEKVHRRKSNLNIYVWSYVIDICTKKIKRLKQKEVPGKGFLYKYKHADQKIQLEDQGLTSFSSKTKAFASILFFSIRIKKLSLKVYSTPDLVTMAIWVSVC